MGDAFRHAFWNAVMTRLIGRGGAARWANAHENGDKLNTPRQMAMDKHNNLVGRETAATYILGTYGRLEKLILAGGRLRWFGHGA